MKNTCMDCYVNLENGRLAAGNSAIERQWDLSGSFPVSVSLLDKIRGREWIDASQPEPSVSIAALPRPDRYVLAADKDDDLGFAPEHLHAVLSLYWGDMRFDWHIRIYSSVPVIRTRLVINGGHSEIRALMEQRGWESQPEKDYVDRIRLNTLHCSWQGVEMRDRTDRENNLVHAHGGMLYTNSASLVRGNICTLRDNATGDGLVLFKEGPTPVGHINYPGGDYFMWGREIYTCGSGISEQDFAEDGEIPCYGSAVGVWHGSDCNSIKLIHQYHRCRQDSARSREYYIMSNTWGDRSNEGCISEDFLMAELDAAKFVGIDIMQIDDGWQQGVTRSVFANGKIIGTYAVDPNFWNISKERLPNGLDDLCGRAHAAGVLPALWFCPDTVEDFKNWERDADILINLHRTYGIRKFKLDGVNISSKKGELNHVRMMRRVIEATGGAAGFNLDTTGSVRMGFLGETQYGNIFLENRYTHTKSYYPHWSLRNLWQLSRYFPAQRLQIEFLNVERNKHVYGEDILSPSNSGIAYAFACAMFSSPLAWMELSGLTEESKETLKSLIAAYKVHREKILGGTILPIGDEPNGFNWTGFQSIAGSDEGYLLFIKGANSESEHEYNLWGDISAGFNIEPLTGCSNASSSAIPGSGKCTISMPGDFCFALYRYGPPKNGIQL